MATVVADVLSPTERRIFIEYANCDGNVYRVAEKIDFHDVDEISQVFEAARLKLLRIAHGKPADGWMTIHELAAELNVSSKWVRNKLSDYSLTGVEYISPKSRKTHTYYPPSLLVSLKQIQASLYDNSPSAWMTTSEIAHTLGASYKWVCKRLEMYSESSVYYRAKQGMSTPHFPPHVFDSLLRQWIAHTAIPEAGDWMSVKDVAKAIGKSVFWVECRIALIDLKAEPRRDSNNRVYNYHPPEVVEALRELLPAYPPQGNWMTIPQVARILGRSEEWVEARMDHEGLQTEIRLAAANKRPFTHIHPDGLKVLRQMKEEIIMADDWLTLRPIARSLDRSTAWIKTRLQRNGLTGELRMSKCGRVFVHYSPATIEILRSASKAER